MTRRSKNNEIELGSDSFLDIVANIVGILIILIVLAGVRVSQAPVLLEIQSEATVDPVLEVVQLEPEPPAALSEEVPPQIVSVDPEPEEQPETGPPEELIRRSKLLEEELARLAQAKNKNIETMNLLADRGNQQEKQFAQEQQALNALIETTRPIQSQNERARLQLEKSKGDLLNQQIQLQRIKQEKPSVQNVKHQLTPVSKTVSGEEWHFRIEHNRVAFVPLKELVGRLKEQIDRRKGWVVKFGRQYGVVGPVQGFQMEFVVERQKLSVVDELRNGRGVMKIGVSQWKIEPTEELDSETAEEALLPGSQFHRRLHRIKPNETVTFWVYPDSFETYRKLQQYAYRLGLTVAARPLPHGVPIAGSPNGSRSAGQ